MRSDDTSALVLFGYLFAIQLGSQVLLRRRGWQWPSVIAVAGSFAWTAIWLGTMPRDWGNDSWLAVFVLATSAAAAWAQRVSAASARREDWTAARLQGLATDTAAVFAISGLVAAVDYDPYSWLFFGLLAAGQMLLARFRPGQEPIVVLAAVVAAVLLLVWPISTIRLTAEVDRFIVVALAIGGMFALRGLAGLWRTRRPAHWALLSAVVAGAFFLIAYGRLHGIPELPSWGLVSLALAAFYVAAAERVARYRVVAPDYQESLGAFALAAAGFIAFAVPLELEHAWIAVGWSLLLPAIAAIESRLRIAWLRYAAWVAAGLVLVRLLPGPWILAFPAGATPFFNWLLYGYGVPLLAFAGAAWIFRRQADDALVTVLGAGTVAVGFLLVTLELHHCFQGGLASEFDLGLGEVSCLIIAWLLIALGLLRVTGARAPLYRWMACAVAGLALAALVLGPLLLMNPLLSNQPVGAWPIVNWLVPAYAVPALLVVILARDPGDPKRPWVAQSLAILALVLGFVFVTLELRQWFQGTRLDLGGASNSETYAYSVGWIAYGVALLIAGRTARRCATPRLPSWCWPWARCS